MIQDYSRNRVFINARVADASKRYALFPPNHHRISIVCLHLFFVESLLDNIDEIRDSLSNYATHETAYELREKLDDGLKDLRLEAKHEVKELGETLKSDKEEIQETISSAIKKLRETVEEKAFKASVDAQISALERNCLSTIKSGLKDLQDRCNAGAEKTAALESQHAKIFEDLKTKASLKEFNEAFSAIPKTYAQKNEVSSVNKRIDKLSLDFITSKSESRDLIQKAKEDMTQQNVAAQIRSLSKSDLEATEKRIMNIVAMRAEVDTKTETLEDKIRVIIDRVAINETNEALQRANVASQLTNNLDLALERIQSVDSRLQSQEEKLNIPEITKNFISNQDARQIMEAFQKTQAELEYLHSHLREIRETMDGKRAFHAQYESNPNHGLWQQMIAFRKLLILAVHLSTFTALRTNVSLSPMMYLRQFVIKGEMDHSFDGAISAPSSSFSKQLPNPPSESPQSSRTERFGKVSSYLILPYHLIFNNEPVMILQKS